MKHIITLNLFLLYFLSYSQDENTFEITSNIGWNVEMMGTMSVNHQPGNDLTIPFFGLGFYPRYNLYAPFDYLSISAGTPANFGLEIVGSSFGSYWQYFFDTPLEFALNFGERANVASDYLFGGYIGAGFGYNYAVYNDIFENKFVSSALGPVFSVGLRYDYLGSPVGIRLAYMPGLINNFKEDPCNCIVYEGGTTPQVFTFSLLYHVR